MSTDLLLQFAAVSTVSATTAGLLTAGAMWWFQRVRLAAVVEIAATATERYDTLAELLHVLPPIDSIVNAHLPAPIEAASAQTEPVVLVVSYRQMVWDAVVIGAAVLGGRFAHLMLWVNARKAAKLAPEAEQEPAAAGPEPVTVVIPPWTDQQGERRAHVPAHAAAEVAAPVAERQVLDFAAEVSPIFAGLKNAMEIPTGLLLIIPPKVEPAEVLAEPVAEVRDAVTVGA
jgi:hypothetical protein